MILLFGCHSASDNVLDSFKKVNASLEKSNKIIDENAYDQYYFDIQLKGDKNKEWASKADTLYAATKKAVDLIDKINETLKENDSAGSNMNISAALLVHTPLGDSLAKVVREVPDDCYAALVSRSKKIKLDSTLNLARMMISRKDWMEELFSNEPSISVLTILSSLKFEFMKATAMTMSDIDNRLNAL